MEFRNPNNIIFILPALAAAVFFVLSFRKKEKILHQLRLNHMLRLKVLRAVLLSLGLGLIAFSLLGPQKLEGYTDVQKTGMDIYVLIDTSKSMLVTDVQPDRLSVAKRIVGNLLDRLEGDRIGFIPFASDAYIQMPLTDDYQLAQMFLNVMDTDMISGGGTNLAAALRLANDSFKRASDADRVIIIISDGEEHDGAGERYAKSIADEKLRIYTIGVGTERGGLVPIYNGAGDIVTDYMIDDNGNPVTSRLNAETLRALAQAGSGSYFQAGSAALGAEISSIIEELANLTRDVYAIDQIKRYQHLFQYFLGAGLILFMAAWFLPSGLRVRGADRIGDIRPDEVVGGKLS